MNSKSKGEKHKIAPLSFGQSKVIFQQENGSKDLNTELVRNCLNNYDQGQRTSEEIDGLPYPEVRELIIACLEINGLRNDPKDSAESPKEAEPVTR